MLKKELFLILETIRKYYWNEVAEYSPSPAAVFIKLKLMQIVTPKAGTTNRMRS